MDRACQLYGRPKAPKCCFPMATGPPIMASCPRIRKMPESAIQHIKSRSPSFDHGRSRDQRPRLRFAYSRSSGIHQKHNWYIFESLLVGINAEQRRSILIPISHVNADLEATKYVNDADRCGRNQRARMSDRTHHYRRDKPQRDTPFSSGRLSDFFFLTMSTDH